jgi:hypothetical protein
MGVVGEGRTRGAAIRGAGGGRGGGCSPVGVRQGSRVAALRLRTARGGRSRQARGHGPGKEGGDGRLEEADGMLQRGSGNGRRKGPT